MTTDSKAAREYMRKGINEKFEKMAAGDVLQILLKVMDELPLYLLLKICMEIDRTEK